MTAHVTKQAAQYSPGHPDAHCGICLHYLGNNRCEIVMGHIDPQYWCKYFKKSAIKRALVSRK